MAGCATDQLERAEQQSTRLVGEGLVGDPLREFKMGFDTSLEAGKCSLVVRVPREALSARVTRPDLVHCSLLQRHRPLARLLISYLLNGLDVADRISPGAAVLFEDHATDLLAQALKEAWAEHSTPSETCREAMYVRACRLIKLRCGNAHLTPEPLALELGISSRLLQRIFAERAETVMKRIFQSG